MSARTVNPDRLSDFMAVYLPALRSAAANYPSEYAFSPDFATVVSDRMRAAFERGSYNHDSRAIRNACKVLGIKSTQTAIEAFLTGGAA